MRLVYLALGWCAGVLLAAHPALRLPLLWAVAAAALAVLAWRTRRIEAAALLLLALGGLRMAIIPLTTPIAAYNDLGGMTITGIVAIDPDRRDDRVQIRLNAETVTRAGATTPTRGIVLADAPPLTDVRIGDRIAVTGLLRAPGAGDRFSYASYLAQSSIYSIMQQTAVSVLERANGGFFPALYDLRAQAHRRINAHLPEPAAGLLAGILLGNERGIDPALADAFAATGAAHVIAISGFNMAVLSGVIIGTLKRLRVAPLPAALLGIAVIAIYTLFVGANAAVARAALMSGLLVVGTSLRRQPYLPASLAFAALVLSALNPNVLWDVSFQLSFFATLGMALFATPLSERFHAAVEARLPHRAAKLVSALVTEPLIVTAAALVFTLPLTMLYFGQVSPVVLLVNLLIVPVQSAILLIGGVATLVAFVVPPLAQILYWLALLPLTWTIRSVRLLAHIPTQEVFIAGGAVAAFFAVIIGAALLRAVQPRWSARLIARVRLQAVTTTLLVTGAGIAVLLGLLLASRPDGKLHVWLLDMGESSAILVQTPRGAQMLIDGGRYPSRLLTALGDRLPFTDRTIEILFLTQPDAVQYAALPALLDRYAIGAALDHGQPNLSPSFAALQSKLAATTRLTVAAGYTLETDDGVRVEVLHPASPPTLSDRLDDHALVLRLTYADVSFLFTSELSEAGQAALLESGSDLAAAVLQVPRRGTALEADFLAAVQPQVAVVQGDHPNPDLLARLGDLPIFRTDDGGTIHLTTGGRSLWVVQG